MMRRSIAARSPSTIRITSKSSSTTTAGGSVCPKARGNMTSSRSASPHPPRSPYPPSRWKVMPMVRRIPILVPTLRNFRANIRTARSKVASGTTCLKKRLRNLPKRLLRLIVTDQVEPTSGNGQFAAKRKRMTKLKKVRYKTKTRTVTVRAFVLFSQLLIALFAATVFLAVPIRVLAQQSAQTRVHQVVEAIATKDNAIRPFRIHVPQEAIDDLHRRIAATRWPDQET